MNSVQSHQQRGAMDDDEDLESSWDHQGGPSVYAPSQYSSFTQSTSAHSARAESATGIADNDLKLNELNLSQQQQQHHDHAQSLDHYDTHSQQQSTAFDEEESNIDRLYDDDFDGMLDDLNRALPPHACR